MDSGRSVEDVWHVARASVTRPTRLSVVAPCYNEADGLSELHRRVSAVCREVVGDDYEIVLVNDGSTDATWPAMASLAHDDPRVVAVNLARNHGHQLALSAGLSLARGERILIIDADLQDPPELLPRMMELMDRGADIVYGQRATRGSETWFKRLTAAAFYRLMARLTDVRIPLDTGDFRLMNRRSVDVLNSMPEQHRFIRGMVSWIGFAQVPIPYERQARFAGTTKYPLKKMVRFALDAITGFSVRPLRLTAYFGMAFAVFGFALLGHALHVWIAERTVAGWTSLMAAILIIGSVQLLVLGVIGEYLGRLYMEAKRRPLFIIERVVSGGRPATRQDSPVSLETSQPAAAEAAAPPLTR